MLVNDRIFTRVTPEKVHGILEQCRRTFAGRSVAAGGGAPLMTSPTRTGSLTFSAIALGSGLEAALAKEPSEVLAEIGRSGLRGRGGAGFPTSLKWSMAAEASGEKKYVVCNADEGEPGTFKDRVILTDFADLVFEGMTIGARVIGARYGIMYLRSEYTYLRPHLESILARRRTENLLGKNIAGREGFDFDIDIHMGSGAYVCGEETAMIESLGRPSRRAAQPTAVPDRHRLSRPADHRQQRGDLCVGRLHSGPRGRMVQEPRHRQVVRLQAVQRFRRLQAARRL